MRTTHQTVIGGPEVIELRDVPAPEPGAGQVRLRTLAAAVNPVDVNVRSGAFPLLGEPPFTLGWDVAGVVDALGPGVTSLRPGDVVCGLLAFPAAAGTHAESVLAAADEVVAVPPGMDATVAAALPLAGLTAWQALEAAAVGAGDRVLVHRAAGGVGHLAVQLAAARGAEVVGTASGPKHQLLRDLGADTLIDHTSADYAEVAGRVDVVIDLLGGEHASRSARLLRSGGRFVSVYPGDLSDEAAAAAGIKLQSIMVHPSAPDLRVLLDRVAEGSLRVHVDEVLPLTEVRRAHELVEAGRVTGKVVLVP